VEHAQNNSFKFKRKEPTLCDADSWIALATTKLLRFLAFERNECRVHGFLHVAEVADTRHGQLLRAENRLVGSRYALNASFAVLTRQPKAGPICAGLGAIPAETADELQRLLVVDHGVVGNLEVTARRVERDRVPDENRVTAPRAPNRHLADAVETVVHRAAALCAVAAFLGFVAEWAKSPQPQKQVADTHLSFLLSF